MKCSVIWEVELWIDPTQTGSYNLMCSGSSLVLLPICWYGNRVDRATWWACLVKSAFVKGYAGNG